jgi:DNA-binding GntR family transcriptional regulator
MMEPKVAAVDGSTLQARVYESLRLALLRGRFVPGEPFSLRSVAEMVGTSAMPVREAIRRLVADGVLVQSPDRTIRVVLASHAAYDELMRLRVYIEGYAAARAARRADKKLLSKLARFNEQMRKSASKLDIESALAANYSFHFAVYETADSPQLLDVISGLWLRSGPMIAIARQNAQEARTMFLTGVKAHQRIIDALAERDDEAARFGVGIDLRAASAWLKRHYSEPSPSVRTKRYRPKRAVLTSIL